MSQVVEVNFGKEGREASRKLARLLGLIEQQEAAILADPVHYVKQAGANLARLQASIREMREVLKEDMDCSINAPSLLYTQPTSIMIRLDEYKRWKKLEQILDLIQL